MPRVTDIALIDATLETPVGREQVQTIADRFGITKATTLRRLKAIAQAGDLHARRVSCEGSAHRVLVLCFEDPAEETRRQAENDARVAARRSEVTPADLGAQAARQDVAAYRRSQPVENLGRYLTLRARGALRGSYLVIRDGEPVGFYPSRGLAVDALRRLGRDRHRLERADLYTPSEETLARLESERAPSGWRD